MFAGMGKEEERGGVRIAVWCSGFNCTVVLHHTMQILKERGIDTTGLPLKCKPTSTAAADDIEPGPALLAHAQPGHPNYGKCCALAILTLEPDSAFQRLWLHELVEDAGHHCVFLPKFHPELNFIERYWGVGKRVARGYRDEGGNTLRIRIKKALDHPSVASVSRIRKHARVTWRHMDA